MIGEKNPLKIKAYSAEAILSQVCLAGAAAAAALFVLWPANSGSGWGFQHPCCQGWGTKPGNVGSSLSVRPWVSQPHFSAADSLISKHGQAESTKDCAAEEVGNTVTVSVGAEGLSFNWLSRWIYNSLLPRNLTSLPLSHVVSPLTICLTQTWEKKKTKNTFIFGFVEPVHCTARRPLAGDANDGSLMFQEQIVGTLHLLRIYRVEDSQK